MMRGCDEHSVKQGAPFPFAPELARCPWSVIPQPAFALLEWEQRRRRLGVLPMGADRIGDLPLWVVEAMDAAASGIEVVAGVEAARSRMLMESAVSRMGVSRGA